MTDRRKDTVKIIATDNFDRDMNSERLIAENVSAIHARCMVEALNTRFSGETASWYFKAVPTDYVLKRFEP